MQKWAVATTTSTLLRNLAHEVDLDSIGREVSGIADYCLNIWRAVMKSERFLVLPALEEVEDGGIGAVHVKVIEEAAFFLSGMSDHL